ncbi:bifunctional nicotinamide-nucleotide adenylyltransferase/Nudix hydroxylase [Thalassospira xiamenensis]|uniref:Bifunctional NMN adenylyltransferase/nudix hydrolase n=1 Tax=Thalassospira xiamenensis TaxID=220697 RepID=A0A285TX18_9PROT|nr:bifunctional nicotinamide-nucleotide adenylyltransferase/Nudix hydroxylase [Thalassospira xiamenensis]SOC26752.1 bifunctional NMN adenylyltransferase/nudix hydrolase [Thalassospira xiamenensis]
MTKTLTLGKTVSLTRTPAKSTQPEYDFGVYIGRFQPFHNGHLHCLMTALDKCKHVILLIGSAKRARSTRNPFKWTEVVEMISGQLSPELKSRVSFIPLLDTYNNVLWTQNVQAAVAGTVSQHHVSPTGQAPKIALVGHSKDSTSFYLHMFPQWKSVNVSNVGGLSATPLRETYFNADNPGVLATIAESIPENTLKFLQDFATTPVFSYLVEESRYIAKYREAWNAAPYPPQFNTVDSVIVQSGHILLIERRSAPGKGLWALPGGFVNVNERFKDGMLRELTEETRIKVPAKVLEGSIVAEEMFDDPHRSERGRVVTRAYLITLEATTGGLPKVRGGDDAKRAVWIPLSEIDPEQMFEDHFHIIQTMLGKLHS